MSLLAFYAYVIIMPISWDFNNLEWKLNALEREFHFELPPEWTCDKFHVSSRHGVLSSSIRIFGEAIQVDFLEKQFGLNSSNKVSTSQQKYERYERDGVKFTVFEREGNRLEIAISKSGLSNWLLLLGPKKK